MCTIGLLLRSVPGLPVVLAANRDEHLDRPTRAPFLWSDRPLPIVAGQDVLAGGTWLGISAELVVGLTNLWPSVRRPRSRGTVVLDLLEATELDGAAKRLARIPPDEIGPFSVVVIDRSGHGLVASTATRLQPAPLPAGVYALGSWAPGVRVGKLQRIEAALEQAKEGPLCGLAERLQGVLSIHSPLRDPVESICVHTELRYGTRSSTILLRPERGAGTLLTIDGAPCSGVAVDQSALLGSL